MNVRRAVSSLSTATQSRILRPAHAPNAREKSISGSAADPVSLSGEALKNRSADKAAAVHWNRPAEPVAVEKSAVTSRRAKGDHEMAPILVILFVLSCLALEAMISRHKKCGKGKNQIQRHSRLHPHGSSANS